MNHRNFQANILLLIIYFNHTSYAARHVCLFPP